MQKLTCALLVDDDQTTNYLNQLLLKRLAVTEKLLIANNGQEALDLLQQHCHTATPDCPVLILLDVKMPIMNGFEFLEAYAQLPFAQGQTIVIVMLTTSLHPQDVQRLEHLNISDFVNKPLTEEKIDSILRKHFARQLPKA
ncbi:MULTISPECIES: response regulator [Hymenobacter]|uniref:Response regulator n=1 Tax=Hymenobacter jejuensis TaxID=2502781 RepID=A0A5B8A1J7_9BACT|nr:MULTISPECIES: response regulator [Hymenobacter]MBC6991080.1 response regulator [Hymenobacter sp. BT491]QDA60536.1 response regulator [Hymenobacter jejuensis]